MATILGGISILSEVYGVIGSYKLGGIVPSRFGMAIALACLYSLIGILLSLFTLRDRDAYKIFSILGVLLNGVVLLAAAFLLWLSN